MDLQGALLRKYFCRPSDVRTHAYVTFDRAGRQWLARIVTQPVASGQKAGIEIKPRNSMFRILSGGYEFEELSEEKLLLLSTDTYEKPDLSLTLMHGLSAAVVFGYRNSDNYFAFRISGPLVYGRYIQNGRISPPLHLNAIPRVKPEYKIEVRHGEPYVFFFVDDYLVTFLSAKGETDGKVGIALQKTRSGETSVTDFVAAQSVEGKRPVFKPLIRIPD